MASVSDLNESIMDDNPRLEGNFRGECLNFLCSGMAGFSFWFCFHKAFIAVNI